MTRNKPHREIKRFALLIALFACCFIPSLAHAQQTQGVILGVVRDASGGLVPGASVTVQNADTNETRDATTGDDGAYRIPALRAGHYLLKVSKEGFKAETQTGLTLDVAQELVINVSLQVGTTSQEVVVTGEATVVNTTNSELGGLVNDQRIADLPLNGRNFLDLTLLQPGVQQNQHPAGGGAGSAGTWYSSNGAPPRSNNFIIDGGLMVNQYGTGPNSEAGTTLGVDGIKEYKVVTSMFGAQYGMTMGSQMVIVSKGGSNEFHGDVFEYLRNNHLDSRNYFDPAPSLINGNRTQQFKRNNFGGSFGGPIRKDKTFFYLVYEGLREAQGDAIQDVTLPAACHNLVPIGSGGTTNGLVVDLAKQNAVFANGANLANPGACASGLTNSSVIPAVVQPWIGQFPLPNEPAVSNGLGYFFPGKTGIREDYAQLRVDQNFSAKDTAFVRYTFDDGYLHVPYTNVVNYDTGSAFPQFAVLGRSRNQWLTFGENHIVSSTVLNSVRLSFSRTNFAVANDPQTTALNPFGPLIGPQWSFVPGKLEGGYAPGGGTTSLIPATTYPAYHIQDIWTLDDDLYVTRGKHAFQFGALINLFEEPNLISKGSYGAIAFASPAAFMTGIPTSFNLVAPVAGAPPFKGGYLDRDFMFNTFGFYAQDDWRIAQRLTFNIGLRYEFMTSLHELNGRQSTVPDIRTSTTYMVGPVIDNPTFKNWSPRIGFAWDIFGTGRTSLRGGFGIYYDVGNIGALLTQNPTGMPPFSGQTNVNNTTNAPLCASGTGPAGCYPIPLSFANGTLGKALQMADPNLKEPHSLQYNLTLEQQIPGQIALAISYVGNRGIDIITGLEGNPVIPQSIVNGIPTYNVTTGEAGCQNNALVLGGANTFANNASPCRVNPYWTSAEFYTAASSSSYNSLQVQATKRLSHGLDFQAAYTWSRVLDTTQGQMFGDDCAGPGSAIGVSPLNLKLDKGPACFNVPQSVHVNVLYHFPNIHSDRAAAKLVQGWWIGNIVSAQGGFPFTPLIGTQRSFDGVITQAPVDRASLNTATTTVSLPVTGGNYTYTFVPYNRNTVITGNPNNWFNPLMFGEAPLGQLGTAGRDILQGPGLVDWDFSIVKDTKIGFLGEGGNLEFRAEIFNMMNHANFNLPASGNVFNGTTALSTAAGGNIQAPTGASISNPLGTAGQITTTATSSRQIQLALKLEF